MAEKDKGRKTKSFEAAYSKLEEVVRRLEAGQLTLAEATSLYEEGMSLARSCNEMLSAAELKISRLQSEFAEQMNLVPDEIDADADSADEEETPV